MAVTKISLFVSWMLYLIRPSRQWLMKLLDIFHMVGQMGYSDL